MGNGGAAVGSTLGHHSYRYRHGSFPVHSVVLKKARVLYGYKCVDNMLRQIAKLYKHAVFVGAELLQRHLVPRRVVGVKEGGGIKLRILKTHVKVRFRKLRDVKGKSRNNNADRYYNYQQHCGDRSAYYTDAFSYYLQRSDLFRLQNGSEMLFLLFLF